MAPGNDKHRSKYNNVSATKFLTIVFVIIITIVIIVDVITFFSFEITAETKMLTLHTHRVIRETDEILIALLNIETAQRGYLLTGDAEFLQPLREGAQDYEKHYAAIVELTADNPRQQERLKTLNDQYNTWYKDTIEILIEQRRQIEEEPMMHELTAEFREIKDKSNTMMDQMRELRWEIENEEWALLEIQENEMIAVKTIHRVVVITGSILIVIFATYMLFWIIRRINKTQAAQKEAEKDLRESEEKHRRLFETMAQGVIYQTADGKIISANPAAEIILGLTLDQMQGKTSMDPRWKMIEEDGTSVPGTDHPTMIALCTGQKVGPVTRGIFHPGKNSHVWLSITAIPLFQPGEEKPFQAYATFTDITARKQAEEELLKFMTAVEQSVDGVAIADMSGKMLFINHAWAEMHGYALDEVKGRHLSVFHNKEQLDNFVTPFLEHLIGNGSNQGEVGHTRKDGTTFPAHMTGTLVKGTSGEPFGMLAIARDITDRKKIEEALKLQASERAAVDTFTYSVSNDLQAPLRRIEGFSEMLLEECSDQLNERARDYLNRIVTQVSSMKALTDALLQLSKVVTREIVRETVDLSALVRAHLGKLQLSEPTRRVEKIVAPNLTLEADVDLTSLIIVNLLDNAWKFTSRVEEALIEFGSAEQNGRTVYYLKDNGAGFDMNHAAKLFTPFNKLHSVEDYPGIGFGLNLVYRIIARHGGEIWAEGEVGKGACFYFTLSGL